MLETVPFQRITPPKGESVFQELDQNWIAKLCKELDLHHFPHDIKYPFHWSPIFVDKGYRIIDGHHRYLAARNVGCKMIEVIKFNCWYEETDILRDFQKHLKFMIPKDYDYKKRLKEEFENLLPWLLKNVSK